MIALVAQMLLYIVSVVFVYSVLMRRRVQYRVQTVTNERSNRDQQTTANSACVTIEMVVDPVCNVAIMRKDALIVLLGNHEYYFCSRDCAERFAALRSQMAS